MRQHIWPTLLAAALIAAPMSIASATQVPSLSAEQTRDTLRGRVLDAGSGQPIEGAQVVVIGTTLHAFSGPDGRFAIADAPTGSVRLLVQRIGYTRREFVVQDRAGVEFRIEPARHDYGPDLVRIVEPVGLERVVVTATRRDTRLLDSPLSASIVDEDELRREHDVSLGQMLARRVPGVRSLSTGEQTGKPVVRGLAGARVLVLDDGLRLEDYSWSEEDAPSLDARLVDRVEVNRGPASVLYGSDAIGGVINAVARDLPDARGRGSFTRGEVELYGASNNAEVGTALVGEHARGALGMRGAVVARIGQDVHTPAGEIRNTGFGAVSGEAAVGLRSRTGSRAELRYARYGGEFKLLEANGPPPGEEAEEEGPERKMSDDRIQLTASTVRGRATYEAKAQWQRHWLAELSDDLSGGQKIETIVFDLLLNTLTTDLMAHHSLLGGGVNGTVGVSGLYQNNDSRGRIALVPDARTTGAAAFAFERLSLGDRWNALAGARVDRRGIDADANASLALSRQTRDYTTVTGDVGLVFEPVSALAFAANVGRAWRAPNLFELFANGPRLGEARYDIGRSDLRPETSLNVDGSVRWQLFGGLRGELTGFRNVVDDFIYVAPTDEFRSPSPESSLMLRVYRYGQAPAELLGGEALVEAEPIGPRLLLRARYDAVRGRDRDTHVKLPLMPPPRAGLEGELRATPARWVRRAYLSAEGERVAAAHETVTAEPASGSSSAYGLDTPAYTLLHLGAGVERTVGRHALRLDLRVRNATDARYRSFLNRYKEFALDPGRSVIVRMGMDL